MGVLAGKYKNANPLASKNIVRGKQNLKGRDSYMEELTRSFLSNFRAFIEAGNQS